MNIKSLLFTGLVLLPISSALAADSDNIGKCGWGSKLMEGNAGIAPQVLAVTTNGTSGNQTFGITSGTSGCTKDGVVRSNWKTALFIDNNVNKLAHDASRGSGESLDSLASLLNVEEKDKSVFFEVTKNNFSSIFSRTDVSSKEVMSSLKDVLASNAVLAKYSQSL